GAHWPTRWATSTCTSSATWPDATGHWWRMPADGEVAHPPLVQAREADVLAPALEQGDIVALPSVGGYVLAVHAARPDAAARLDALVADPDGPHYQAANSDAVKGLTSASAWNDEIEKLLARCWPGPLELFLPRVD